MIQQQRLPLSCSGEGHLVNPLLESPFLQNVPHEAANGLELLNTVKYDQQGQTFFPPEEAGLVFAPLNDPGPAPSTMLRVGQSANGDTASSEPHTLQPCAGGPFSADSKCIESCPQHCFNNSNENALRTALNRFSNIENKLSQIKTGLTQINARVSDLEKETFGLCRIHARVAFWQIIQRLLSRHDLEAGPSNIFEKAYNSSATNHLVTAMVDGLSITDTSAHCNAVQHISK